ncbi:hypothetical protein LJR034_008313 [Caballeronia sp. LjRoot34]|jgi:hypothetical protein|uniref:hypothetical protein n=1 Tax=Caballeronia sp. LjRoot34 TaxID=3342325 RepID=UPI003ED0DC92
MTPCIEGRYADPTLSELELAATVWLDGFYQLEHLFNTRAWVIDLSLGAASPELRFAALTHDAERFFPGGPTDTPENGFDNPDYLFAHSTRSANIVEEWLRQQQPAVDDGFIKRVRALILRHEIGGGPEADILQAADSLSFLEIFDWLTVDWVRRGVYSRERAREKLRWSLERIRPPLAVKMALPLYESAVKTLESANEVDIDLKWRRKVASDRRFQLGEA